jgi:hypothetical protein
MPAMGCLLDFDVPVLLGANRYFLVHWSAADNLIYLTFSFDQHRPRCEAPKSLLVGAAKQSPHHRQPVTEICGNNVGMNLHSDAPRARSFL